MKKMTKVISLALALVMCLALCACGQKDSGDTAADGKKTFIMGVDPEYPPFSYLGDDGKYKGFDLDLAAEVAQRNGWEFDAQAIDWNAKDSLIEAGTITCLWNGFTMEGRETDYAFSEPYMNNSQVIMVKAGSDIKTEADLAGKNVLTQAGSAAETLLEDDSADGKAALAATFAGGKVNTIADYTNAVMQLEAGAVDAIACDSSIADYFMAQKPDTYTVAVTLSSEHYAVGFKKDNQAMADAVTKTLKEMVKDGTVAKICEKYAAEGINADAWCLEA